MSEEKSIDETAPSSPKKVDSGDKVEKSAFDPVAFTAMATVQAKRTFLELSRTRLRTVVHKNYRTNEDFSRMDPSYKRILVVGCTGAGKSTLINKLAGCKKIWIEKKKKKEEKEGGDSDDEDGQFEWDTKDGNKPIFESGHSVGAVTSETSFSNCHYLGNEDRPFVVVDTPGHDDPEGANIDQQEARDKLKEQAADLYAKLKNMGHVQLILVIHNDIHSNRLNPATYELLKKVDEMFADGDGDVWEHVVMAYSKCDADTRGWKDRLPDKKQAMQGELKKQFPNCKVDVPILTLSGVTVDGKGNSTLDKDFEALWSALGAAKSLDTAHISKFEGLNDKVERIIEERDMARRVADARKDFPEVSVKLMVAILGLCVRTIILPFLDFDGVLDEILWICLLAYMVGPKKFMDFVAVLSDDWVLPKLESTGVINAGQMASMKMIALERDTATKKKED